MKGAGDHTESILISLVNERTEFVSLVQTLKINIVETFVQKRDAPHPRYFIGEGKLEEVEAFLEDHEVDSVLFNGVLKPSQHYNLENRLEIECIDRLGIILKIFIERARTKEAKLQVDLARLQYEAPYLREWIHTGKEGEHPGFLSGGEYRVDIYYDFVKRRMNKIKKELELARIDRSIKRQRRREMGCASAVLVGYTNVGKSTLFNVLTGSGVLVDEMLFSTLSTTTRNISKQRKTIVIIDTIGFIEGMPPWLIESFKATLEEIQKADVIIWVFDGSESIESMKNKYEVCVKAIDLKEKKPVLVVINKADLIEKMDMEEKKNVVRQLTEEEPILVSAKEASGTNDIVDAILKMIMPPTVMRLEIVNTKNTQSLVSNIFEKVSVKSISYGRTIDIEMSGSKKDLDIIKSRCRKYTKKSAYIEQ